MDSWPLSLQQNLDVSSFEKRLGDTRVSSDNDVGPAKVRSRYTKSVDVYTCQIELDFSEVSTFETFYKTTLGNGTLPFIFKDPFTQVDSVFRFSPKSPPTIRPLGSGGRVFTLNMVWEILP